MEDEAKLDIKWWKDFISNWNRREMVITKQVTSVCLGFYNDASGQGMAVMMGRNWFSKVWP